MADAAVNVLKRYRHLLSDRSAWELEWREAASYIMPRKSSAIGRKPTAGEKQTRPLFDSTAISANQLLGASLSGNLTSPAVRWFRLKMRDEALNRDHAVQSWLEECANRIYATLQQSNWNAETFEVYLDLGAFGTGAMFMVEREETATATRFGGMLFRSLPIGTYVIAEDDEGKVNTLMYTFQLSAEAVLRRFRPDPKAKDFPQRLVDLAEQKPNEMVDLIHAVYPRPDGTYNGPAAQKPWASCYLVERDKAILEEGGYDTFPFSVPRWTKASGEVYGRGPGHTALPDIKTLNKMTEMELRQIAKAIDPPMLARNHGVIGAVRTTPGGLTIVKEKDSLTAFESGAKFQVGQIKSQELKGAIREMFHNNQLQLPSNQPQTATEIERRYEIMNRTLGPTVGRLEYEHTNPVVMQTARLMAAKNALPPAPELVERAAQAGAHFDIVSEGPLSRAQKGSDVLAIERSMQIIFPMAQVQPNVLHVIKMDEAARVVMEASNVPSRVMASDQEVQAIRQAEAKVMAEEQQKADLERLAMGASKVAPLLSAVKQPAPPMPAPAGMPQAA